MDANITQENNLTQTKSDGESVKTLTYYRHPIWPTAAPLLDDVRSTTGNTSRDATDRRS